MPDLPPRRRPPRSGRDDVATQIGEIVARISRRLRAASAKRLAPFGLTDGEARALRMIGRAHSPLRMSEIARRMQIVPRSATTVIAGLEGKGLVVREVDPADRRSVLVRLTDAGAELHADIGRARDEAAVDLFNRLGRADQLALVALLGAVDAPSLSAGPEVLPAPVGPAPRRGQPQ